jgi:multiple sugar transport system permease protein
MKRSPGRTNTWIALAFLAPNLCGFLVFTLGPIIVSFLGSFTTWSLKPSVELRYIGLQNYIDLFSDPQFYFYLFNTIYMLLDLPVTLAGSLGLAVLLSSQLKPRNRLGRPLGLAIAALAVSLISAGCLFIAGLVNLSLLLLMLGVITAIGLYVGSIGYRTLFYLPHFTAGAGTILLWMQLYNPEFGLINQTIEAAGNLFGWSIEPPRWLASTKSLIGFLPLPVEFNNGGFGIGAREAIMLMGFWSSVGGNTMILYLAAITNIPPEMYEAADIDGANGWQRFIHITFPQLAPTTFFLVVMGIIGGMQGGFEQARLMTQGGPAGATTTLSYYIYAQGFERLDLGYGAAVAWVLFVLIMILTVINWRYGNRFTVD